MISLNESLNNIETTLEKFKITKRCCPFIFLNKMHFVFVYTICNVMRPKMHFIIINLIRDLFETTRSHLCTYIKLVLYQDKRKFVTTMNLTTALYLQGAYFLQTPLLLQQLHERFLIKKY